MGGQERSRVRLLIAGRVQGVGFRYATQRQAESSALDGWVRNLADGRVEVVAEGPRAAVQALVDWCGSGPRYAAVHAVNAAWETPSDEPVGFRVRYED